MQYKENMKYTKKFLKNQYDDWNLFEKSWLIIFTITNLILFYLWQDTWLGLLASLTGMLTVVLVAKGKISNYYFGIINVIAYAYIAYQNRYFGEFMLNAFYFLPIQFIGLYYWLKHRNKNKTIDDVVVRSLSKNEKVIWGIITIFATIVYGLVLVQLGNTLPFVDSSTTILSIIAMILMVKRTTEQWLLWIIVDIISIFMWMHIILQGGNEITMVVMWTAYLVNAIYGYYNWKQLEKNQK